MSKPYSQVYLDRIAAGIFNKMYIEHCISCGSSPRAARRSLVDLRQRMKQGYTIRPVIIK